MVTLFGVAMGLRWLWGHENSFVVSVQSDCRLTPYGIQWLWVLKTLLGVMKTLLGWLWGHVNSFGVALKS